MPSLPPPLWADLYLNGTWTSITNDVSTEAAVTVTRGRSGERDSAGPAQGSLPLINKNAKYSRRNPNSALYGAVGLNTPVRYGVAAGSPWVLLEGTGVNGSYLSTPSNTGLNISGDIEIRWEMTLDNPADPDGQALAARQGAAGARSWRCGLTNGTGTAFGNPFIVWSTDGTALLSAVATAPIPVMPGQRFALRIVLDINNGAGGNTTTFYTAKTIDADEPYWQMLGTPVVNTGTTSLYNPTQDMWIMRGPDAGFDCAPGRLFRWRLYNAGSLIVDLDTSTATVGASTLTDAAARVWTLNGAASLTNQQRLFHGEIPSWNPSVDKSGREQRMATTPAGIMQRLGSGNKLLRSPLFRDMTNPGRSGIVAYWSCEEPSGSTVVSSGLGQPPMRISGTPTFGSYTGLAGSDALPDMAASTFTATVASYTVTGTTSLRSWVAVPSGGVSAQASLYRLTTTGTNTTWELLLETDGDLTISVKDSDGTSLLSSRIDFNTNGKLISVVLETTQSGSNINWTLIVENYTGATSINDGASVQTGSGTISSQTYGRVTGISVGRGGGLSGVALGHITLANDLAAYSKAFNAAVGWRGEGARARFNRLCQEQGVSGAAGIDTTYQPYMGAQKSGKFLDLLREVETTDGGILTERPDGLGLAYRGASTMWGQQPALVIDWTAGLVDAITPKDDDKAAFNEITVRRIDGAEYTYTLDTGVNSVADIGLYDTSADLSVYSDDALPSQAYRRVQLATVDEMRYPLVSLSLANSRVYAMLDKIYAVDIGDLIRLDHIPADYGAGYVDLIVVGIQDAEGPQDWSRAFVCVPGEPWNAGVVGSSVYGRADTDGSQLAAAVTSTATRLSVTVTDGPLWTTDQTECPMDIRVGGEVMTVTRIMGAVHDDFNRTVAAGGWGTADTGETWTVTGGSTSDYSVQGV